MLEGIRIFIYEYKLFVGGENLSILGENIYLIQGVIF